MSLHSATRPLQRGNFFTSSLHTLRATELLRSSPHGPQKLHRQLHTCHTTCSLLPSIAPARHAPRLLPSKAYLSSTSARYDSSSAPPAPEGAKQPAIALTWNEFFRLRQRRRYLNVGSSLFTSSLSLGAALGIIAAQDLETLQVFGLDPLVASVIAALSFAAVGWLCGPIIGSVLFRMFVRRSREMPAKEQDFYGRIKRYRVDPSSSSMQNPVPDFYGEKITSVAGYRRWLKDQRAFNRKRESFL